MLDKATFAVRLTALAERFGRAEPSDALTREYYENLSGLDTDAFLAASRTIFREDNYFPSPARFLDLAGEGVDALAEGTWGHLMHSVRVGEQPKLNEAGAAALRSIGGYRAVAYCDEIRDLPYRKRAFLKSYIAAATRTKNPALPAPNLFALGTDE